MLEIKVILTDGDYFKTSINATEEEIKHYYPIGGMINVGLGPGEQIKQIKSVEITEIKKKHHTAEELHDLQLQGYYG